MLLQIWVKQHWKISPSKASQYRHNGTPGPFPAYFPLSFFLSHILCSSRQNRISFETILLQLLFSCLRIIQNGDTRGGKKGKPNAMYFQHPLCSEKRQQNLHTKEWGGTKRLEGTHFLRRSTVASAAAEKLKEANMLITKSSLGSCASCPAQFAAELGRIGGSSDPCSHRFRGLQPCSHIGSSS